MVLDDKDLNDIIARIANKIGVKLDEAITLNEVMKKVVNQNLSYINENTEIDILGPGIKNAFFLKNAELVYNKDNTKNFNHDYVVGAKFINNKTIQLTDINGKKINLTHDVENGDNYVGVKINKKIPLDIYLKMIS